MSPRLMYLRGKYSKDKKSVAINVTLQAKNRTLGETDLDQISKKVIEVVKEKTGASIRS